MYFLQDTISPSSKPKIYAESFKRAKHLEQVQNQALAMLEGIFAASGA